MPPELPAPIDPKDHLLPPHQKPVGPIVGAVIIIILLLLGALYFWDKHLNNQGVPSQIPLSPYETTRALPR